MTFRKEDKKTIFIVIIITLILIYPVGFVYKILTNPSDEEDLKSSSVGKIIIF